MNETYILVIEDEPEIASLICLHLERIGFDASIASNARSALESVQRRRPSLILLDLLLPDMPGLDICKRIKSNDTTSDIPIIIVSALGDESDVIIGLELGATDYVTKPFSPKVLMARVRAVLRREQVSVSPKIVKLLGGAIVIDDDRHTVKYNGREIELTSTEYGILLYLANRPGFVRTRDQIMQALHGESVIISSRTVDVHVTSLRKKLGEALDIVETVRGVGYRISDGFTGEQAE